MTPRFVHDCDRCTFIATAVIGCTAVDLYRGCDNTESYYILRYSSEGSDYRTVHRPRDKYIRYPDGGLSLNVNWHICQLIEAMAL